jgi:lipoprotein-anchoring transpeptidase ErfK/SrfK
MDNISEFKLLNLSIPGYPKKDKESEIADRTIISKSFLLPVLVYASIPVLFSSLPFMQETFIKVWPIPSDPSVSTETSPGPKDFLYQGENRMKKLDKIYARFSNRLPYLIVNTSDNTFTLFNNGKLVREGLCSTGSFVLLDAGGEQKWMFETPKGMMHIQGKTESPVWRKPDWAFIEEGLPIPKHADSFERYEYGVLGDYALSIGNGYLIHGTLYKRLLGMPVTHGCVRMDDADLEKVYRTLRVGSKVYIF